MICTLILNNRVTKYTLSSFLLGKFLALQKWKIILYHWEFSSKWEPLTVNSTIFLFCGANNWGSKYPICQIRAVLVKSLLKDVKNKIYVRNLIKGLKSRCVPNLGLIGGVLEPTPDRSTGRWPEVSKFGNFHFPPRGNNSATFQLSRLLFTLFSCQQQLKAIDSCWKMLQ